MHSFTDLGLSGQLLLYLLFFLIGSIFLAARVWKLIPSSEKEASTYSREFWIFIGALTLCLMAFQVLVPTSFPVFNSIVELFGGYSSLAPPANQIEFYSKWQLWFAIGIAFIRNWSILLLEKMDKEKLKSVMSIPVLVSLVLSAIIFSVTKVYNWVYIITLTVGIYSIVSNTKNPIRSFQKRQL